MDFGLGKGVWPKEKFPSFRPHPHCLCLTLPTVLAAPAEFLRRLPPDQRRQLAPKWAQRLAAFGVPWDRLQVMEALGPSLEFREWGEIKLKGKNRQQEVLQLAEKHLDDPVAGRRVSSLKRHYLTRRYKDGVSLKNPEDLQRRFDEILRNERARVYWQNSAIVQGREIHRYVVFDPESWWLALIEAPDGRRVTATDWIQEPIRRSFGALRTL